MALPQPGTGVTVTGKAPASDAEHMVGETYTWLCSATCHRSITWATVTSVETQTPGPLAGFWSSQD